MRRLAAIFAILFLAACGSPAAPGPTQTGFTFAQPPGEISQPDGTVPPLPPSGHIGVGALLYTGESLTPHLVLSSGQHLRLPSPPSGEGRNGTMLATLSPDGRWLGHRKAGYARDKRYLIRDLNGKHPTMEIQGSPLMWSPEGRFLFMDGPSDSSGYQLIEPASGKMSQVPYAGGLGAIRPGGLLLSPQPAEPGRRELKLSGPGVDVTITFATDHNHECWCPKSYQVSPDGTTIAILLVYQSLLVKVSDVFDLAPCRYV